jgi:hypothetical protein
MTWHLFWAALLIAVAGVSLVLLLRRVRAGSVPAMAAAGGVVFRVGLMLVGALYLAGIAPRSRTAFLAALGVIAAGAVLNLLSALFAGPPARDEE